MPKRKFSLRNNQILTFENGVWNSNTGSIPIKFEYDGYYYTPTKTGAAVLDVDRQGNPNTHNYIGGEKHEVRDKYWQQYPIMRHATDSIAAAYNISPELLRRRLGEEGFVDDAIRRNNRGAISGNYDELNERSILTGFQGFGLDDVADYINEGKVIPINENWEHAENTNEQGRQVNSAHGLTTKDNIGLTAATLKYFRDKAKKDFPNASRTFLDEAAGIYYQYGPYGGKRKMKNKH